MQNTELQELIENVFAPNTVTQMLSDKGVVAEGSVNVVRSMEIAELIYQG